MTTEQANDAESPEDSGDSSPSSDAPPGWEGHDARADEANKKTLMYIVGLLTASFLFAWVLSPWLYRMVCKTLDPGGSSASAQTSDEYDDVEVDESREIKIRFTANVQGELPWTFKPQTSSVTVHPGEKKLVNFASENLNQQRDITGKGVYDINPPSAGQYFKKIECFCFKEQTLKAGQQRDMPLYFWLDPDLPEDIDSITLAYTFFNAETSRERSRRAVDRPGRN